MYSDDRFETESRHRDGRWWHPLVGAVMLMLAGCLPADAEPEFPAQIPAASGPREEPGVFAAIDDLGRAIELAVPARRIISLQPAATEMLVALGAGPLLVARTEYDEDPGLAHLPSVGGGLTPSLEALAALAPDLVIAWEEAGTARIRPRLEALGIAVFATRTRDTTGIYSTLERLGALTGLASEASLRAAEMRAELAAIQRSVEGLPRPRVLYLVGIDPPLVATPALFIGELLEVAGGENLFAELTAPSPQVSLEEIVRRRPEVVLIPSSGAASASLERLRRMPGWRELDAHGGTRFVALPPDLLHRPGPGIVEAARVLRAAIHPEFESAP